MVKSRVHDLASEFGVPVEQVMNDLVAAGRTVAAVTCAGAFVDIDKPYHLLTANDCAIRQLTAAMPERSLGQVPQLPDVICIYKRNLERMFHDREDLVEEIRITVLHEIGHYFGLDDDELP